MQRNTIRENIEIFIVTKNSTFRYQLLLWYTEGKRKLTSLHKVMADQAEEHSTIPRALNSHANCVRLTHLALVSQSVLVLTQIYTELPIMMNINYFGHVRLYDHVHNIMFV